MIIIHSVNNQAHPITTWQRHPPGLTRPIRRYPSSRGHSRGIRPFVEVRNNHGRTLNLLCFNEFHGSIPPHRSDSRHPPPHADNSEFRNSYFPPLNRRQNTPINPPTSEPLHQMTDPLGVRKLGSEGVRRFSPPHLLTPNRKLRIENRELRIPAWGRAAFRIPNSELLSRPSPRRYYHQHNA